MVGRIVVTTLSCVNVCVLNEVCQTKTCMCFIFLTVIFSEYLDNHLFGYWVGKVYAFGVFLQIHSMRIEGEHGNF